MTHPSDDRIARALEEMRDLQREHLEIYRQLAADQRDALQRTRELQATSGKRLGLVFTLIVVILVMIMGIVALMFRRVI